MTKPALTVLTDPMPVGRDFMHETFRRVARRLKYAVCERSYASHPCYRGHFAVTRSLIQGLEKIGADFNYSPLSLRQLSDTVVVLAGVDTLRQAIHLKQQGHIRRLYAGPNIVNFSSDHDSILASSEVDAVITPSNYVDNLYIEDNPSLQGRIFSWPAGVDTEFWAPSPLLNRDHILLLDKRLDKDDPNRVMPYIDFLLCQGWSVDVLVRDGSHKYTHEHFRKLLHRSCLMLGFTVGSESQGIAWAEAWAADVPTLIWRNTKNVYNGRSYNCSTAPYLGDQNGLFFDNLEHFKHQFNYWESHRAQFVPRLWTLENMSDEVCAKELYEKVTSC